MLLAIRKHLSNAPNATSVDKEMAEILASIHEMAKEKPNPEATAVNAFHSEIKSLLIDIVAAVRSQSIAAVTPSCAGTEFDSELYRHPHKGTSSTNTNESNDANASCFCGYTQE